MRIDRAPRRRSSARNDATTSAGTSNLSSSSVVIGWAAAMRSSVTETGDLLQQFEENVTFAVAQVAQQVFLHAVGKPAGSFCQRGAAAREGNRLRPRIDGTAPALN